MVQLAVRCGAISVNPVRELDRIEDPTKMLSTLYAPTSPLLRQQLKPDEAACDITHIIVRVNGQGLLREARKSAAGDRTVVPNRLVVTSLIGVALLCSSEAGDFDDGSSVEG